MRGGGEEKSGKLVKLDPKGVDQLAQHYAGLGFEVVPTPADSDEPEQSLDPLPLAEVDGSPTTYQTIESLPVCDFGGGLPEANQFFLNRQRLFLSPAASNRYQFDYSYALRPGEYEGIMGPPANPEQEKNQSAYSGFRNWRTDQELKRLQATYDNFVIPTEVEVMGEKKKSETIHLRANYRLCRSDQRDSDGGYRLWTYASGERARQECNGSSHSWAPLLTADWSDYEKWAVFGDTRPDLFCSASGDFSGQISVQNDFDVAKTLMEKIDTSAKLNGAQKERLRLSLYNAFLTRFEAEILAAQQQARGTRNEIGFGLFLVVLLFQIWLQQENTKKILAVHKEKIDPTTFLKDITSQARLKSFARLIFGEEIIDELFDIAAKQDQRHVLVTGEEDYARTGDSAGGGKSEHIKEYLHRRAVEGYKVVELSVSKLATATSKWSGKPGEAVDVMFDYLEEIAKSGKAKGIIVWSRESHGLKGLGTANTNPTDVVEYALDRLEQLSPGSQIIFDTNKPWGIPDSGVPGLLDDEAFGRRVTLLVIPTVDGEKAFAILSGNDAKYLNGELTIGPSALRTLIELSPLSQRGALPDRAFSLLDRITARLRRQGYQGDIGEEMVVEQVASFARISPEVVRSFQTLAKLAKSEFGLNETQVKELLSKLQERGFYTGQGKYLDEAQCRLFLEEGKLPAQPLRQVASPKSQTQVTEPPPAEPTPPEPVVEGKAKVLPASRGLLEGGKGFVAGAAPLLAVDVLEHYKVMDKTGAAVALGGMAVGMTLVNPYTPAHIILLTAPFEISKQLTKVALAKTGVPELQNGELANTIGGTLGGLLGAAATVKATGGVEVWQQVAMKLQDPVVTSATATAIAAKAGVMSVGEAIVAGVTGSALIGLSAAGAVGLGLGAAIYYSGLSKGTFIETASDWVWDHIGSNLAD